jgi:beta-1,4-mannosyltransferase
MVLPNFQLQNLILTITESPLHPGLINNPLITIVPLAPPPHILQTLQRHGVPFLLMGPLKVLWQIWTLFYTLGYGTKPARWLLVQNPPTIPTLLIGLIICFIRNTHLLIDWHNYGWTILSGTRGPNHPLVRLSKTYEMVLGRWAPSANFTVTEAMAKQLQQPPYSITSPIFTLHDRPAEIFQPITDPTARKAFLAYLPETKDHVDDIISKKTRLLVSSTSWTPDEDFSLLLSALVSYSTARATTASLPRILAIITGKGPQKAAYLSRITSLQQENKLSGVTILSAWLSMQDYATLLACADLGVCLHMSSSGVDLPMKVVDMFGAGLPVVGYCKYESWPELVREGENGRGFVTSDELCEALVGLFGDDKGELERLREGARKEGGRRWDEEWDRVAGRVLGLCD